MNHNIYFITQTATTERIRKHNVQGHNKKDYLKRILGLKIGKPSI